MAYTIDAAGQTSRTVTVTSFPPDGEPVGIYGSMMDMMQGFDGDGLVVKKLGVETLLDSDPEGNVTTTKTFHLLRSTVLGGKVVSEIGVDSDQRGFVYLEGAVLALQYRTSQTVNWEHRDAGNASVRTTSSDGTVLSGGAELDPLGSNAGLTNTVTPISPRLWKLTVYPGFGNSGMDGATQCTMDGFATPCSLVLRAVNNRSAEQCPDNDCGPRHIIDPNGREHLVPLTRNPESGNLSFRVVNQNYEADDDIWGRRSQYLDVASGPSVRIDPQDPVLPIVSEQKYNDCAKLLGNSPAPGYSQTAAIVGTSALEGTDPTLLAVTWAKESSPPFNFLAC